MIEYLHTMKFIGKRYVVNNTTGKALKHGDKVIVHPTEGSISRQPYNAVVIFQWIKWVKNPCVEVCTNVDGGYIGVMNDYLFNRLEPIV